MGKKRVGFFCSPIGLGHASRDVAVAKLFEDVKLDFVSGGGAARLIAGYGFEVQNSYRPPAFEVEEGGLKRPLRWLWQYYRYYKDCKRIATDYIESHDPDVVISDEDFASLSAAQERNIPSILITDILKTRFTSGVGSIIEKKMNRSMQDIMSKCRAVILPESGANEGNILRVGPIVRDASMSRDELRKKFSFTKKTITISAGGTDAGKFLIQKALEATANLDVETVLVSGPSIQINEVRCRSLGFVNNLHEIIYASDVIVSLAGKSTIDEARAYGTPGIFIPIKNHFEQEDNAREEGFAYEDIFRLREIISQKLNSPRNQIRTDGAQLAWNAIRQFL